jgi:hypothetical protein
MHELQVFSLYWLQLRSLPLVIPRELNSNSNANCLGILFLF